MARKAKEELNEVKEKVVKKEPSSKKVASKKTSTSTKNAVSKVDDEKVNKKTPSKKLAKVVETEVKTKKASTSSKKQVDTKKTTKTAKKETSKKDTTSKKSAATEKKSTNKKVAVTKKSVTKKAVTKNSKAKTTTKAKKETSSKKEPTKRKQTNKKVEIVEYYDLPYRYNQTIVKVLAQTPTTLFVYWDISDDDRKKYIEQYGEYFFHNTKPVLIIHNKTKNSNFEVDINDFANSWYLRLVDSDCDYQIELGRRPINKYVDISNNYLYITTSNEIESPNDHILFDKLSHFVYFKNVKTNELVKKNITNLTLLEKIGKLSSVSEFYKKLYPEEAIVFDRLDLRNPSSGNPTSSFK